MQLFAEDVGHEPIGPKAGVPVKGGVDPEMADEGKAGSAVWQRLQGIAVAFHLDMLSADDDVFIHNGFGDFGGVGDDGDVEAAVRIDAGDSFVESESLFINRYSRHADGEGIHSRTNMAGKAHEVAKGQVLRGICRLAGHRQRFPDCIGRGREIDLLFDAEPDQAGGSFSFEDAEEEGDEQEQGHVEGVGFFHFVFLEIPGRSFFHVAAFFSVKSDEAADAGDDGDEGIGHDPADIAFHLEKGGNEEDEGAGEPGLEEGACCGMRFPVGGNDDGQVADVEGNDEEEYEAHDA